MNQSKMTAQEKLEAMGNVLDKLSDTNGGRAKCGLIWVMNDLLNQLDADIQEMEAKLSAYEKAKQLELNLTPDESKGE